MGRPPRPDAWRQALLEEQFAPPPRPVTPPPLRPIDEEQAAINRRVLVEALDGAVVELVVAEPQQGAA